MGIEKDIHQQKFRNEHQRVYVNLFYTHGWIMEKIKQILEEADLTPQQYNILRILRGSHPKPLSTLQIRDRLLDKMSDTSRIVDRLLLKKLVAKKPNRADKRLVDITITEAGLSQLQQLDEKNSEMDAIVSNLSQEEAVQLSCLLDKIRNSNGHHIG